MKEWICRRQPGQLAAVLATTVFSALQIRSMEDAGYRRGLGQPMAASGVRAERLVCRS
jgi:hypothetical protein